MKINMNDISKRLYNKEKIFDQPADFNMGKMNLYTESGQFILNNALYALNHWSSLDEDTNSAFNRALDIFVEVCINCNNPTIVDCASILAENVTKVRSADQLINSIKYRNSRVKSKISTKVHNKVGDVTAAINRTINDITSKLSSKLASNGVASGSDNSTNSGTEETTQECFNMLLNNAIAVSECDRIIENYKKISKRFNLEKIVSEITNDDELYTCVGEIAKLIDTYNIPFKNKYNAVLENTFYVFNKSYMNYPSEKIIEAATDYFILSRQITDAEQKDIQSVIEMSVLFDPDKFQGISFLLNGESNIMEESVTINAMTQVENYGTVYLEDGVKDTLKSWVAGNPEERENQEVKKMIEDFRKQCAKDTTHDSTKLTHLKALITKLFTKSPSQIVQGLPNIFSLIRMMFVVSTTVIHPILGLVTIITNYIMKMTLERKQMEKIINYYKKEIDAVNGKIEKTKNDKTRENLEEYKKKLEQDLEKLKERDQTLYTDDENYERDSADSGDYEFDDDFDLGDDDFNFDDDDFNFDEQQIHNLSASIIISELVENINEVVLDNDVDGIVYDSIFKFNNDTIDALADFSITVPVILEKSKLKEALLDHREEIRNLPQKSVNDYIRISSINDTIKRIDESSDSYNTSSNMKNIICSLLCVKELATYDGSDPIMEMNFTNSLKLAVNNIKKGAIKLSDKEKRLSNNIDVSVSNVSKGLEDALTNDSREAIIKGRVLPSASKTIKLALATGFAWMLNPAIAVIGAIGAFACSKKLRSKERQLVLDDIDVELKMCERYLQQAEEKTPKDMDAIRQIEKIQRNLQRQKQRIQYKMHIMYNEKVPNTPDSK